MKKLIGFVAVGASVSLALAGYLLGQPAARKAGDVPAVKAVAPKGDDEATIRKAGLSFVKAYAAGDAAGLAAHWTENGEYFADDGTTLRGRASIEKSYAKLFEKKKEKVGAEVEVTSIRFPSKDTAIEEGYFKVRAGKEAPVSSKYSILHAREGGKWLMAVVREWSSAGTDIRDLEWLIGTWEAKRDGNVVRTTYQWWGDKSFIRADISITQKDRTVRGFQMIGKDAATGAIRSWTFDEGGSFGQATWARDGRKWEQDTAAVLDNGSTVASTNILTRIDDNAFTFQSVERTLDGEPIADIPPVRVKRVTGKEARP